MSRSGTKITSDCDQFVYNYDIYDGEDPGKLSFDDTDVVGYEFINQGTTLCRINDGLLLYPQYAGIAPSRWSSEIQDHENDTTIYRIKFEELDFIAVQATFVPVPLPPGITSLIVPGLAPAKDLAIGGEDAVSFNRLLVITKVKVGKKTG